MGLIFLRGEKVALENTPHNFSLSSKCENVHVPAFQVFHTHGEKLDKSEDRQDLVESLEEEEDSALERNLKDAYRQTFDLVDADKSGTLDRDELMAWFDLCGSEIDLSKVIEVLLSEGELTREKFATLMCTSAKDSRRDYDVDGKKYGGHH